MGLFCNTGESVKCLLHQRVCEFQKKSWKSGSCNGGIVQLSFLKAPCSDSNAILGVLLLDIVGLLDPLHPVHSHPTYVIPFDTFCDFWSRRKGSMMKHHMFDFWSVNHLLNTWVVQILPGECLWHLPDVPLHFLSLHRGGWMVGGRCRCGGGVVVVVVFLAGVLAY